MPWWRAPTVFLAVQAAFYLLFLAVVDADRDAVNECLSRLTPYEASKFMGSSCPFAGFGLAAAKAAAVFMWISTDVLLVAGWLLLRLARRRRLTSGMPTQP